MEEEKVYKTSEVHRACSARYYEANKARLNAERAERHRKLHPPKPKKPKPEKKKKVKRVPVERLPQDVVEEIGDGHYARRLDALVPVNPVSRSKKSEFIWIVEGITGKEFDSNEWTGKESVGDSKYCICSQAIEYQYIITHKPTNISFSVGSQCVKKVSQHLYDIITHTPCKAYDCTRPVMDKRRKAGRCGYCSDTCHECSTLTFGKYKDADIQTIPDSYWKWMERTVESNEFCEDNYLHELLASALDKRAHLEWFKAHQKTPDPPLDL